MLYNGIKRQIEQHLEKLCAEKIAPAFPPGGAAAVSAGIILPESLLQSDPSVSGSRSASAKGKAPDTSQRDAMNDGEQLNPDAVAGASMSATQAGDRTDAVARIQAGERLMTAIRDIWLDHRGCMSTLSDILKYLVSFRLFTCRQTAD